MKRKLDACDDAKIDTDLSRHFKNAPTKRSQYCGNIDNVMANICSSKLLTSVDKIQWWSPGTPHDNNFQSVGPICVDNFIVAVRVSETSITGRMSCEHSKTHISALQTLFRTKHIKPASIKMVRTCKRDDMFRCAVVRYKLAVADLSIDLILEALSDRIFVHQLESEGIYLYNIDIKHDYAATVTPDVVRSCEALSERTFQGADAFALDDKATTANCVVMINKDHTIRAKIYNKFVESICSNGICGMERVGCNVGYWIDSPQNVLNKEIQHSLTQQRGLSRIEITFMLYPTRLPNCHAYLDNFVNIFIPGCNYTRIKDQWSLLKPENTVVVYDCVSSKCILGRWKSDRYRKINGVSLVAKNMNTIQLAVGSASVTNVPIEVIMLTSDEYFKEGGQRKKVPGRFTMKQLYMYREHAALPHYYRDGYKYRQHRFLKCGLNQATYFHHGLFSDRVTDPSKIVASGLADHPTITVAYRDRQFRRVLSYKNEFLVLSAEVVKAIAPAELEFVVGNEYQFYHTVVVNGKCLYNINGYYVESSKLSKDYEVRFSMNKPFKFELKKRVRIPTVQKAA